MGQIKNFYDDYLSSEDFDLMFDGEYEIWLEDQKAKQQQYEAEQEEYYQAIGDGINSNYCN